MNSIIISPEINYLNHRQCWVELFAAFALEGQFIL